MPDTPAMTEERLAFIEEYLCLDKTPEDPASYTIVAMERELVAALRAEQEKNLELQRQVRGLESELRDVATLRDYARQIREQALQGPITRFFQRGDGNG